MSRRFRAGAILAAVTLALTISACTSNSPAPNPNDHPVDVLHNDLPGGELTKVHTFNGENFQITTAYSTTYNTGAWRITDSKTVHYSVRLTQPAESTTILLAHVHADVNIAANKWELNGIPQDSMDEHLSNGDQAGPEISVQFPSDNDFAIEGYSDSLTSGWGYIVGSYGSLDITEKRLTEKNLHDQGATGNKLTFVYKLLVKGPGQQYWHSQEFTDEIMINTGSWN